MAYNFFPTTVQELQNKTTVYRPEIAGEVFLLFTYLKQKFPKVATPINIDTSKQS